MSILRSAFAVSVGLSLTLASPDAWAQAEAKPLTLSRLVDEAGTNYPSIRISQEELNASSARLDLARTAYLPKIDANAQFNRGTRNNVFGSVLPQGVIPPMSGPVIGTNNGGTVWGSAIGLLISWQPFDFGVRRSNVKAAEADRDRSAAANLRTKLEVQTASADAYFAVLASSQALKSAQTAVENWGTLKQSIHALTTADLRPGADESRVGAEQAAASNQVALAQQALDMSLATLRKFQGALNSPITPPAKFLSEIPTRGSHDAPLVPSENPMLLEKKAATAENDAQLKALKRSWTPQFNLQGAAYARGTGAETDGTRLAGANGLGPNVGNYVVGVNVTFPVMDFVSIYAKASAQASMLRAAQADEDLATRTLQEQFEQAQAELRATGTIAQNTPLQLEAARTSLNQATARYKAGLAPIDDVAQAQRLLVQADIDNVIARISVWRAFLKLQYVRGNLQPFLDEVNR